MVEGMERSTPSYRNGARRRATPNSSHHRQRGESPSSGAWRRQHITPFIQSPPPTPTPTLQTFSPPPALGANGPALMEKQRPERAQATPSPPHVTHPHASPQPCSPTSQDDEKRRRRHAKAEEAYRGSASASRSLRSSPPLPVQSTRVDRMHEREESRHRYAPPSNPPRPSSPLSPPPGIENESRHGSVSHRGGHHPSSQSHIDARGPFSSQSPGPRVTPPSGDSASSIAGSAGQAIQGLIGSGESLSSMISRGVVVVVMMDPQGSQSVIST